MNEKEKTEIINANWPRIIKLLVKLPETEYRRYERLTPDQQTDYCYKLLRANKAIKQGK
jgi:hypothetical protein